ncbi:hypothetical protein NDU88_006111 [Pleurodeles waltl]|uniref:Uncharacterized protein n=1 Tax=Pleurodeles waltl TaxID=8319 RepID=A0AAV7SNK2_PLEWA|nr:hypothetical protein NDU88_006111 [Pleurodeles waltl]
MAPHSVTLQPAPRAFVTLRLSPGPLTPHEPCPVLGKPPRAGCTADQGAPFLRATPGSSTRDQRQAGRTPRRPASCQESFSAAEAENQAGHSSLRRPRSPGTSRDPAPDVRLPLPPTLPGPCAGPLCPGGPLPAPRTAGLHHAANPPRSALAVSRREPRP